ncbi:hypothetical protein B1NLA3E_07400 [Bacillus sp. 1NLA3E]|nr:hypothetical protein B1NLA3E_07400 [Bacillus sp. 1NLA3E]
MAFIVYLFNMFFSSQTLEMLLNVISILLFMTAIIGVARFYFIMAFVFLGGSITLAIVRDVSWLDMISGFSTMVKLVLFIGMIPLISTPIENYMSTIKRMIRSLNQRVSSFQVCHLTTFILANFINMAAIPISKTIFFQDGTAEERHVKSELSLRAFGLAMMCSPIGAAVALAIDITGTKWISLLSINLIIIVVGLFLSYQLSKRSRLQISQNIQIEKVIMQKHDYVLLGAIFIPFFLYFIFLLLSERFFSIGMMETIVMSVLPFTFLWSLVIKKVPEWWDTCRLQVFKKTPNFFGQFSVIISAGLLVHTFELTGLNKSLTHMLPGIGTSSFVFLYIPVAILLVLILSILGVHQFVAMIFTSQIIHPGALGINPIIFASALLVGFASGMLASAFSGATITMSGLLQGTSSYMVARKNYPFSVIFIVISSVVLILLNFMLT